MGQRGNVDRLGEALAAAPAHDETGDEEDEDDDCSRGQ